MSIALITSTPEVDAIFSDSAEVQSWLDFEAALARAQARLGVIPEAAAQEIAAKARVELLDFAKLRAEIDVTVHPIVPLVRMLAELCEGGQGEYIHWGATTQDALDTGLVLRLRRADETISRDLVALVNVLRQLAMEHRDTVMAGRTHGQHAVPITLGYKLAVWVDELQRHRASLEALRGQTLVVQFGGAVGTLSSLGPIALDVRREIAHELGLKEPMISWHVARDRIVHYTFLLTLVSASLQRLAAEIVLLQRNEISELAEPFHGGKVGSSTMPHKRNPALSEAVWTLGEVVKNEARTALSSLGSVNERDKAVFSVENDYVPRVCGMVHRSITLMTRILQGLTVDPQRMADNAEASRGQLYSERVMMHLAGQLGRQRAHDLVYDIAMRAFDAGEHLRDALARDARVAAVLEPAELVRLFDSSEMNHVAASMVDRVCGVSSRGREH